jgi:hypothetical protein
VVGVLGPPATPAQRRRQQASHARFDQAVGLVEQAAKAATMDDQPALDRLVARMEQTAFDDFEYSHRFKGVGAQLPWRSTVGVKTR